MGIQNQRLKFTYVSLPERCYESYKVRQSNKGRKRVEAIKGCQQHRQLNLFHYFTVWQNPWKYLLFFFLLLSVCLFWAIMPIDTSLAQSGDMPFSVDPAPGTPSYKTGYFIIHTAPGETFTETLRLRNDSDAPLTLSMMSVDASTGPYGGISYGLPGDPVKKVGTWISLPANEVALAPREEIIIPVVIKVPADASNGDNVGGIAVWLPRTESQAEPAAGGQSSVIDSQIRRVVAVQVVVTGAAEPLMVIKGVRPIVRPDGVYFEIDLANEGKLLTKGDGFVELPDNDFQRDISLETFVPESQIAYPVKWINDPDEGTYQAHVLIHYDNNQRIAEWWGPVSIGPQLIAEEQEREGDNSHTLLYIILLAAAIIIIGIIILIVRRRRRDEEE